MMSSATSLLLVTLSVIIGLSIEGRRGNGCAMRATCILQQACHLSGSLTLHRPTLASLTFGRSPRDGGPRRDIILRILIIRRISLFVKR